MGESRRVAFFAYADAKEGVGAVVEKQVALDVALRVRDLLRRAGVQDVWVSGRCSTEADFYSYRRDAGQTGRMWAVIGLPGGEA